MSTDGSTWKTLIQAWVLKGMEGESQIQEHIQWDLRTKGWMPLFQALGAVIGLNMIAVGLSFLGWGTGRLADIEIAFSDGMLVGTLFCLLFAVLMVVFGRLLNTSTRIVVIVFTLLLSLMIVSAVIVALRQNKLDTWGTIAVIFAPSILIPGMALAYRQLFDLFDPFGKTSPLERMVRPHLAELMAGAPGIPEMAIPYRIGTEFREPLIELNGEDTVMINLRDRQMLEFIEVAKKRGLTRRNWIRRLQPNITLPVTGLEITKDEYNAMIDKLAAWGIIWRGGDGKATRWRIEPAKAIEFLNKEIISQVVERQR
jgi:hypothetical protein